MAQGDVTVFNKFLENMGAASLNLNTDTFKLGLIDSVQTPLATATDPRWGAGGSQNYLTNECTPGGNYVTGGESLSAVITDNWSESAGTVKFDGDDVSILQHASNPANARWGIIFDNTAAGKEAVAFLDLGSVTDLTAGDFTVTWNASGIFDIS